jgi:hypothetical protein
MALQLSKLVVEGNLATSPVPGTVLQACSGVGGSAKRVPQVDRFESSVKDIYWVSQAPPPSSNTGLLQLLMGQLAGCQQPKIHREPCLKCALAVSLVK